jgi:hypothetical protein
VTTSPAMANLRSQIVTSSLHGGRRYQPYAFTEQGVAMLSSVLRSMRAVEVNIAIMRTFVQLRRLMDTNRDLARKIEALEKKYDEQFAVVFAAIKELVAPPAQPKNRSASIHNHVWRRHPLISDLRPLTSDFRPPTSEN